MARKSKPIRPTKMQMFGIANNVGSFWTYKTFFSRADAEEYLAKKRAEYKALDLRKHSVVPVNLTIEQLCE